jgi:hypothetical protein
MLAGSIVYSKLSLSDNDIPQAKVNGLVSDLAGKEGTIAAGTTSQYWRGDKSWQTLETDVVSEGVTNLYFTGARAKAAVVVNTLAGDEADLAPSVASVNDALDLKANDSAVVKSVNGVNPTAGAVTINSDDVGEGATNLYFTDARAKAAAVADEINNGTNDVAPSQNAVYDALALKVALTGLASNANALGASLVGIEDAANQFTATTVEGALAEALDAAQAAQTDVNTLDGIVVKSVNGVTPTTGAVTIGTDDVGEGSTNLYFTDARAKAAAIVNSAAGTEIDQAASVSSMKSYVGTEISTAIAATEFRSLVNDNAGAITAGQFVYIKSNGAVDLARANATGTCETKIGVVRDATVASAASGKVTLSKGTLVGGFTGLTVGDKLFLSVATAGGYTQTCPSNVGDFIVELGEAISATEIEFDPKAAIEIVS